jgi:hypothetical protein
MLKPWTLRLPEDILNWIRRKAAEETIKRNEQVSMNTLIIGILTKVKEQEERG